MSFYGEAQDHAPRATPSLDDRDLDADGYIFPKGHPTAPRLPRHSDLLAHCQQALYATVCHDWTEARHPEVRQQIARRLTAAPLQTALDKGALVHEDWYGAAAPRQSWASLAPIVRSWHAGSGVRPRAVALVDFEPIEILNRLRLVMRDNRLVRDDSSWLIRVAFHAALNPIFLCPSAYPSGELFTVAAWLGILHRGRDVVMPAFIACYWMMLLNETISESAPRWEPDAFLLRRAASAIGLDALRVACMLVLETGPIVMRRRPMTSPSCDSDVPFGRTARAALSY